MTEMKKIMFNDRYGLTQAVLDGRKTMTRRIIPDIWIDFPRSGKQKAAIAGLDSQVLMMDLSHVLGENFLYPAERKYQPKYYKGDEVAVAQSYHELNKRGFIAPEWCEHTCESFAGYNNKMFVRADLMPYRIRITNIKVERLQDISDVDAIKEGIYDANDFMNPGAYTYFGSTNIYKTPHEAFASLIDRISGKGTWERNLWVYAYEFELIK
jgi:hypothetical protein